MNAGREKIDPGQIGGWPSLYITYATDADRIQDLLPPGIKPGPNPHVHVSFYQTPVPDEPEYGVRVGVEATYEGTPGYYTLGYGITQESAIFVSRDMNGQPKYPCEVTYYLHKDDVTARASHQGYTFVEFKGRVGEALPMATDNVEEHHWWVKVSPAVGGAEKEYDFPPHVVRNSLITGPSPRNRVEGALTLHESPWDPIKELLPVRDVVAIELSGPRPLVGYSVTRLGALDPDAFWPYVSTIGGSRWPGERGGPRSKSIS